MTKDLIERLEAATGADRELDWLIYTASVAPWNAGADWADEGYVDVDGQRPAEHQITIRRAGKVYYDHMAPYTASLDASLGLVGEKLGPLHPNMTVQMKMIRSGSDGWYNFAEITWPSHERQGRSRTPALAVLIALLKALETK